ncbi:MAG: hypothetical protein FWB76_03920 [Oscillospiraceae bacterium]|nr:hypothetical protein [Oscillospiraceae bacterium]
MKKLLAILLTFSLLAGLGTVVAMANYHGVTCCTPGEFCSTNTCECDDYYCGVYCDCDPWPDEDRHDPYPDVDPDPELTASWWRRLIDFFLNPLSTLRDIAYPVTGVIDAIPTVLDVLRTVGNVLGTIGGWFVAAFGWIAGLFS